MPLPGAIGVPPQGLPPGLVGGPPPGPPPQVGDGVGAPLSPGMAALTQLAGVAPQQREKLAAQDAAARLQIAVAGVSTRSAKAAEHFTKAILEIQKGIQVLDELGASPLPPPPNLLGGLVPGGAGTELTGPLPT